MKIMWGTKDGGPDSNVYYYGIESKRFGSITLLLFKKGSRPVYHSHAFNSVSWVLSGGLREKCLGYGMRYDGEPLGPRCVISDNFYFPSFTPIHTYRTTYHMVEGISENNWVFSMRGPWDNTWYETHPDINAEITLTHGRKVVNINERRKA